ncbi:type III pantothenate kinase [Natranaerovirga pectinivora]|uniref:Type III pantothenate kinase n=1 Tax=Natranaerovirga pectinivora TaxID=682400 RepID=A0A4V2V093_9FIRM|nr:type III pantothenate kinase [Natranaerovirga pectinivora]TCT14673.1 type III pantothenate kinase [Natranaerovirga pectinivora]
MLLVMDIGNTNITIGTYKGKELIGSWRMTTKLQRTSDEYGLFICNLLKHRDIEISDIKDVIISSVVPNIMYSFVNAIKKYFKTEPLIIGPGIKTGIKINTENPKEVGADRIVDIVAAYELYGGPAIVIDFGTATTYDVVTEDGSFIAAITSPGIKISANALWQGAAKLPEIEIKKPQSILARDTITSMQAGLVYGYIGQVEYIIKKIKEELDLPGIKVISTGGLAKIIFDETDSIEINNPMLTLEGLRIIYEKNT